MDRTFRGIAYVSVWVVLWGTAASIADFSVYHCLWFITRGCMADALLGSWPAVRAWYARIAALEAEVADLNECLTLAHMDGFEKGRDAARAAMEGKDD